MNTLSPTILALPRNALGTRSNVVWGVAWLVVIESMVIASLLVSYFYYRVHTASWPPAGIPVPKLGTATIAAGCVVASVVPMVIAMRGIAGGSQRRLLFAGGIALVLLVAYLGLSIHSLATREFTWRANAYGSIVWTMDGYQLMHAIALFILWMALLPLARRGHFERHHHAPLQAAAIYWYFTAISSFIVHVTVYFTPRMG